jgi:hypothetical protein
MENTDCFVPRSDGLFALFEMYVLGISKADEVGF